MGIEELTSNTLTIVHSKSVSSKIIHFLAGMPLLALAIYIMGWGWRETPTGEYPAFAPLVLVLSEIGLLAGAIFFVSSIFDRITYSFDKVNDRFLLRGRKFFFKRWSVEGPVSGITGVSCEVRGIDEHTHSEIYLTYRDGGVVTETVKCGTGEVWEDESTTDTIKTFLESRD